MLSLPFCPQWISTVRGGQFMPADRRRTKDFSYLGFIISFLPLLSGFNLIVLIVLRFRFHMYQSQVAHLCGISELHSVESVGHIPNESVPGGCCESSKLNMVVPVMKCPWVFQAYGNRCTNISQFV